MATPKDVVLRYVDAFNRGALDELCAQFAPDALVHGVLGWGSIEQVRPVWRDLIDCFNINLQVDAIIAEDERVAVRYTERGQSVRSFRGLPVTGLGYEVAAMEWFELRDGLIYRRWGARDSAAQYRQMGLPLS